MVEKTCFVIMPIAGEKNERDHFSAVYETFFRPNLEEAGYKVIRGDEDAQGGSITRQIVGYLKDADLVLADLTDFNPNVMYELAVRHTLRKSGTILVYDTTRKEELPFNLSSTRTIPFRYDVQGLLPFKQQLRRSIEAVEAASTSAADNIIHEYIPWLPENIAITKDEQTQRLQDEIDKLSSIIEKYRSRYGALSDSFNVAEDTPIETIRRLAKETRDGKSGVKLAQQCEKAIEEHDFEAFIEALEELGSVTNLHPQAETYSSIARSAMKVFGSRAVFRAVIELGRYVYPDDTSLKLDWLAMLREGSREEQHEAREELEKMLEVNTIEKYDSLKFERNNALFKVYFDILYILSEHRASVEIIEKLERQGLSDPSMLLREKARAIGSIDGVSEALPLYREALIAGTTPGDDTTAVWYGNTLNNMRRYVDAAEAYLVACMIDPDDGVNFAHVAQSIARDRKYRHGPTAAQTGARDLPEKFSISHIYEVIWAAMSVGHDVRAYEMINDAVRILNLDQQKIMQERRSFDVQERGELARGLYSLFKSNVTSDEKRPANNGESSDLDRLT